MISVVLRFLADALELFFEFFQVLVRKLFKIDNARQPPVREADVDFSTGLRKTYHPSSCST